MNNTTHLPQKIDQIAKNAPNKAHLNNRTESERLRSNKKQSTEKRKNKKEARSGAECVLFCSGYEGGRNDRAEQRNNFANT